jgi:hypothetical protein
MARRVEHDHVQRPPFGGFEDLPTAFEATLASCPLIYPTFASGDIGEARLSLHAHNEVPAIRLHQIGEFRCAKGTVCQPGDGHTHR